MKLTLYNMDVLQALARMPSDSIDCICTSPPYWGLRNYGKETETIWPDAWKGQLGLEPRYKDYLKHLLQVTAELKRVLKPTGTLWWNHGQTYAGNKQGKTDKKVADYVKDTQKGLKKASQEGIPDKCLMHLPERLSIAMVDLQGWCLRNDVVWHKPNHMPSSVKDRLSSSWEHLYFFTKAKKYYFNLDAICVPVKYPADDIRRINQDKMAGVKPFAKGTEAARHYNGKLASTDFEAFGSPRGRELRAGWNSRQTTQIKEREQARSTGNKELIKWVHEHGGNPCGKNPGDVWDISPQQKNCSNNKHDKGHDKKWEYTGDDFWTITTKPFKGSHFAVFPQELPSRCIKAGSPEAGIILDPFAGSGTTLAVALKLGRAAMGIEINPNYIKLIEQRTHAKERQAIDNLEYELIT